MEATDQTKTEDRDPDEWALDFSGTEGDRVVQTAKEMAGTTQEHRSSGEANPRGRGRDRMPMGEELLETTVKNGGEMLFAGMSWAADQDMTLEPDESRMLTKHAVPVVKHRMPTGKQFLPDVLLACTLVNLMYEKFDIQKVI